MLFPAYYNFGSDTAESVYDLNVTAVGMLMLVYITRSIKIGYIASYLISTSPYYEFK